jgi:hypothetical protein
MIELLENNNYKSEILEINRQYDFKTLDLNETNYENLKIFSIKDNLDFVLFTSHTPCMFLIIIFNILNALY